jgi:hypothetical protein
MNVSEQFPQSVPLTGQPARHPPVEDRPSANPPTTVHGWSPERRPGNPSIPLTLARVLDDGALLPGSLDDGTWIIDLTALQARR